MTKTHATLDPIKRLMSDQRHEEAEEALRTLDSQGEASAESQYLLGTLLHRKNLLVDAVDAFKRAMQMDPAFVDAAISLSIIYNDTGRYEDARELYRQAESAVRGKPHSPAHSVVLDREIAAKHVELGDLYRQILRFGDAALEYKKALLIDPRQLDARIHLAKSLAQQGEAAAALQQMQALVKDYPTNAKARVQLALLYFSLGNVIDSQMELSQALVHNPNDPEVKMYLAMTKAATVSTL